MEARKPTAAVAGYGAIGRRHAANLLRLGAARILVVEVDEGVKPDDPRVELFRSLEAALERMPDFVVLATPSNLHAGEARRVIRAGRPLFVEKPLALGAAEARGLVEAARAAGLPLRSARPLCFLPGMARMRDLVESGELGRPLAARIECGSYLPDWTPGTDYRSKYRVKKELGGGVVFDLIHELDYLLGLFPERPERVRACTAHRSKLELEVEDLAEALVVFEGGLVAAVHLDWFRRDPARRCEILFEEGTATFDILAGTVVITRAGKEFETLSGMSFEDRNEMYLEEMRAFLEEVAAGAPQPDERAAAAVGLAEAIHEAARTGREARLS